MAPSLRTRIHAVARLVARDEFAHLADGELLQRFTTERDGAAFETLVRRHGGMVLGVCGRVLGRSGDADDAFQATFFALARRGGSIRSGSVAGWLYRVARRVSVRAARQRVARVRREARAARPEAVVSDATERADWWAFLDRELERLPTRYREAFVLCHLEGRAQEDAARELGCPLGTLHSRLARAKERLRQRLGAVPLVVCVVSASQVRAAVAVAGGSVAATPAVASLSQGVWNPMTMMPTKFLAAVLLAGAAAGAGVMTYQPATATATQTPAPPPPSDPTLDELKRENERLRRKVAYLERRLSFFNDVNSLLAATPPTDQEVLRALPKTPGNVPGQVTMSREDMKIVKNKLVDCLDPPGMYPLVGPARLRHLHWECLVYYTEKVQTHYPFPVTVTKPRVQVVYIDKDMLMVGEKFDSPLGNFNIGVSSPVQK